MAIESVRVMQGAATKYVSDFSVTLKQIRTTSSKILLGNLNSDNPEGSGTVDAPEKTTTGRVTNMIKEVDNQGVNKGKSVNVEILDVFFDAENTGGGGGF